MTSFPYFSGASSCLASASHPCSNLFSPLSVVSSHASHRHLTSAFFSFSYFRGASLDFGAATHLGATCFPRLPGYQNQPRMHISPRKHFLPHFPGCSPMPYGSLASFPAELFLRSRGCVEFPEKKVMWSAELSEEKG